MSPTPIAQPRRILMTADTVGGVWTYALELIRALEQRDVEVGLATMGALLSREQRKEAGKLRNAQIFESDYKLEWMENPWSDLEKAGQWLQELERCFSPDLIHLNGYVHAGLPFEVPKLVVGHSCVLSWWRAVKGRPAPNEWNQYRSQVTRALRSADLVVAPSEAMLAALQRHYGPLRSVEIIPNGRDPARFKPLAKENFILTAGRLWDEAKNVAALVNISPALPWPVYVAGEVNHPDQGQVQLDHVCLLSRLSLTAIASWYGRAAIYTHPARYEPFGLSVLEAALAECALVLGDIPSLRGIWDDAALFVPPTDTASLQQALQSLIRDPALLREYGRRARTRALEYSPERMASAYLSAYSDLMVTKVRPVNERLRKFA